MSDVTITSEAADAADVADDAGAPGRSVFLRRLAAITAVGVGWQLLFIVVWRRDYVPWGDAHFYYWSGQLVAEGEGWINPLVRFATGISEQAADHPPLFIGFLAVWSMLGVTGVLAQMVLTSLFVGGGIIAVGGFAGREIGGDRLGLIAAGLIAVYPGVWGWQGTLLSEPVAALGVTTFVLMAYRYWHAPSIVRVAALGAALGFAAYGRAELLLLSVVVVVPLVLGTRAWSWWRRIGGVVVAGAVCLALLLPWVLFNLSRFSEPVLLSAGYEVTLATANCESTYHGPWTGYWSFECANEYLAAEGLTFENSDQSERSAAMLDGALDYIGDNIERVPTVVVARWARLTSLWKPIELARADSYVEDRNLWVTGLAHASWFAVAGLAIAGAVVLRRRGTRLLPLLGPLLVVVVTATITFGQSRYRASVEPVVAILAAVALERLWAGFRAVMSSPDGEESIEPMLASAPPGDALDGEAEFSDGVVDDLRHRLD